jgi:class 3 adenylate cyclase
MGGRTEVRYARSDDAYVAYRVVGDGPLDVLWYPGASLLPMESIDDEPSLTRIQDRLATFSRVIEFDVRGVGLSDPSAPSSPPTLEQWVQDAIAVLDSVGVERAAVFAPRDSSLEAVLLATSHPDRVASLIVVNGTARMRRADDYPDGIPDRIIDRFLETNTQPAMSQDAAESDSAPMPDFLSFAAPSVAGDVNFRSWWERAGHQGASPASARAILAVVYNADVRSLLPLVQVPTLVLHRRDSANFRIGHGRYLAEHIPGAKFVELAGADCLYWVGETDLMLDEVEEFLTGTRHGPNADRLLATVLFTDIVGSTEQLATLGERRWREVLDRHDAIVSRQVERFRGRHIKATGDGALATFDGPARAVLCAGAIRGEVAELGLQIRAGVHTGELEVRGADVAGMAVHIAARIEATAGPGEILVSRTVVDLIIGSGIEVTNRGDHDLKGVPGSMTLSVVDVIP